MGYLKWSVVCVNIAYKWQCLLSTNVKRFILMCELVNLVFWAGADEAWGGICVSVQRYNWNRPETKEGDSLWHSLLHRPGRPAQLTASLGLLVYIVNQETFAYICQSAYIIRITNPIYGNNYVKKPHSKMSLICAGWWHRKQWRRHLSLKYWKRKNVEWLKQFFLSRFNNFY